MLAKAEQQRSLNAARQAQAASKAEAGLAQAKAEAAEFQAAVEKARQDRQKQIDEAKSLPTLLFCSDLDLVNIFNCVCDEQNNLYKQNVRDLALHTPTTNELHTGNLDSLISLAHLLSMRLWDASTPGAIPLQRQ